MANDDHAPSARVRWARLRFQILGTLMAAPADDGELKARIEALAARAWRHPTTGESIRFSFKTIERWWYIARDAKDPFAALARKVPSHAGTHPSTRPRARRGDRSAAPRPPAMDLAASPRQPRRARPRRPTPGAHAQLPHRVQVHERAWRRARPQTSPQGTRRRRAVRGARDPLLRGLPRARALAPGLPRGFTPRTRPGRTVAKAATARRSRRPLPTLLPPAVVSRRNRRSPHPRPLGSARSRSFSSAKTSATVRSRKRGWGRTSAMSRMKSSSCRLPSSRLVIERAAKKRS